MAQGRTRSSDDVSIDDALKQSLNINTAPNGNGTPAATTKPKTNGVDIDAALKQSLQVKKKDTGGSGSNVVPPSTLPNDNVSQPTSITSPDNVFPTTENPLPFQEKQATITTPDGGVLTLKNNPTFINPNDNIDSLQKRVLDKTATDEDFNTLAQATGKSVPATIGYVTQGNKIGASIENNENVSNTLINLSNFINRYNQAYGTAFDPKQVLSSSKSAYDFLNLAKNSTLQTAKTQDLTQPLNEQGRNKLALNIGMQPINNELLNQVIQRVVQEQPDKDKAVNDIAQKLNPVDYARNQKALNSNDSVIANLTDATNEQNDLFNYQKGIAELKYNDALKQNAINKISQGTVSGDNNLVQQGQQDLGKVDNDVIYKYPALIKQQIAQQVNDYIAKKSGVVEGYDTESGHRLERVFGTSTNDRLDAMKQLGILDDPKTKDIAVSMAGNSTYFANNSLLGNVVPSFLEPFANLGMSVADLTGLRNSKDVYADNLKDQIFQKDFASNNPSDPNVLHLKDNVAATRTIANTSFNLLGMLAISSLTEGAAGEAMGVVKGAEEFNALSSAQKIANASKISTAQQLGAYTSFGLPSFDASLKDSKNFIDNEPAQYFYAAINSIANAEGGRVLDLGKITRIPGVSETFAKVAEGLSDNSITKEVAQDELDKAKNKYVDFALKYSTKYAANVAKGAATMAYFNIANNVIKMGFGDPKAAENLIPQAGHAFLDGVLGMSIMGFFGAAKDMSKEKNTTFKGTIYSMALNHDAAADVFKQGLDNGTYSEPEYHQKMQILNTAIKSKNELDAASENSNIKLSQQQKSVYVANRTAQGVFNKIANQDGIPEETKNKYLAQSKRLGEQNVQILQGLEFSPTLEPLYNLFDAKKEYNTALENYNPDDKKSVDDLDNAKQNLDKVSNPVEISDTQILPTFEKVKSFIPEEKLDETQSVITKINNAENINVDDLSKAEDNLYTALDKAPEAAHLIEPLILKIQNYPDEFKTKTETGTVTEKVPIEGTFANKSKPAEIRPALEQSAGSDATITSPDGSTVKGKLNIKSGQYVLDVPNGGAQRVIGEKAITDRDLTLPSEDEMDNPIQFDKDGNVESVTFKTHTGDLVTIHDPEKALDFAIQIQADKIGNIPDAAFDKAYETVQKEIQKEVPISSQSKTSQNEGSQKNNGVKEGGETASKENIGEGNNAKEGQKNDVTEKGVAKETAPLISAYREKNKVTEADISDEDLLKSIAQQAQNLATNPETGKVEEQSIKNPKAYENTVAQAGKELVDAAIEKYPAPKESVSTPTDTESEKYINSLEDGKEYTAYVSDINDIPEQFRDRATKVSGEIKTRKSFLGIPYGKETTHNSFRYTFTGKEAKDEFNKRQPKEVKASTPTKENIGKGEETIPAKDLGSTIPLQVEGNGNEQTNIEEHPEIKNLEKERNAEIEKEGKPDVSLNLLKEEDFPKEKEPIMVKKGRYNLKIGEDEVPNKKLVAEHEVIKNKQSALESLINCLTKS